MQDFTGVPCVVDLAAMRDAIKDARRRPAAHQPAAAVRPRDRPLRAGRPVRHRRAPSRFNARLEMERNRERYALPALGPGGVRQLPRRPARHRHRPPGEPRVPRDASSSSKQEDGALLAYPDTLVGTDSHTTMINGLGVLGWGVGGIEAEAAMLGQPMPMLTPEVIGFKLTGQLREGATATDLVLTVTQMLRAKGVVGKFVEFYGAGLSALPLADRATIANMAPEYGATMGFFPVDAETLAYLRFTGRAGRRSSSSSRRTRRSRASSAPTTRRSRCSPTRSRSTSATSSRASPARSGRRTACASRDSEARRGARASPSMLEGRAPTIDPREARALGRRRRQTRRQHRRRARCRIRSSAVTVTDSDRRST